MSTEFLFVWISDERQSSKGLTNKTIGRRKHYHAHRCIWVFYFYPANVFLSFDSLASFSCFIFLLRRMVEESFRFGKFPFWFWNELRTHLARNGDFLMLAVIFIQVKFTSFVIECLAHHNIYAIFFSNLSFHQLSPRLNRENLISEFMARTWIVLIALIQISIGWIYAQHHLHHDLINK